MLRTMPAMSLGAFAEVPDPLPLQNTPALDVELAEY